MRIKIVKKRSLENRDEQDVVIELTTLRDVTVEEVPILWNFEHLLNNVTAARFHISLENQ